MRTSLAGISFVLFTISIILWICLTMFEAALVGLPATAERILTFLLLVLPAGIGVILGIVSLVRNEGRTGLAVAGILLNGVFALFIGSILLLAG